MKIKLKTPYLIQRLTFKKDGEGSFDDVLRCDYMGSSEFEFGALPKSLQRISKQFKSLETVEFKNLKNSEDKELFIISERNKATTYFDNYINKLATDDILLKESSAFKDEINGVDWKGQPLNDCFRCEVWWDLENDVLFTFGETKALKILKSIEKTREKKIVANKTEWF